MFPKVYSQSQQRTLLTSLRLEQLSHELAVRFAKKCFTPLELTHLKDNFRSLADEQDGVQYWKEETLCRFLVIPDKLGPGPVIYQMASYLGSFPFPSLAPSILTLESLIKVIAVTTERYNRLLQKGSADRNKLLFRSLAVFDRKTFPEEHVKEAAKERDESVASQETISNFAGFSVDKPEHDNEDDEDDDELALSALEILDSIDLYDHSKEKVHHAQIPADNFRRLVMLLLVSATLGPQENLAKHAQGLTEDRLEGLRKTADSVMWSFPIEEHPGIFYHDFHKIIPTSLPYLFDGLNPLFEHFLFSKNIDLSRKKLSVPSEPQPPASTFSDIPREPLLPREGEILDLNVLSQLSFFIKGSSIFSRLRPLFSAGNDGFSMGSFEQKVLNWHAPTILLVRGTRLPNTPSNGRERTFADKLPPKRFPDGKSGNSGNGGRRARLVFGAYLNLPWKHTSKQAIGDADTLLFQLEPIHEVFRASTLNTDYATFTKSGIGFGSPPPKPKPVSGLSAHTALGPVSLMLDDSLEFGVFTHDISGGGSFFCSETRTSSFQDRFEIDSLEVWGCGGDEEALRQKKAWDFEEREAALRRNLNLGKDVEADRALLEMAGIIGNHNASGGSMG